MDIKNARLKRIRFKTLEGDHMHGFVIAARGETHQFYSFAKEETNAWIDALKQYVIMSDLHEEIVVKNLLGKGNSAKVHQCERTTNSNRSFALKTISKTHIKLNDSNTAALLSEIDIMRFINHSNIISLHEVYESTKYIHLLLPLYKGGELFKQIKKKHLFKEYVAVGVMKNFLSALAYLHENLIVHRDLKPENLVLADLNELDDIKVIDFGLAARLKSPQEKLDLRCGSPGYVAPEVLNNDGYNCKADIFSAGVIFYVILTGRPLFQGTNAKSLLINNMKCKYEFNEYYWGRLSEEVKDLVMKMLHKDPEQRISAEEALQHPWFSKDFSDDEANNALRSVDEGSQISSGDFEHMRRLANQSKGMQLASQTPVYTQVKRDAPPETPSIYNQAKSNKIRTPIVPFVNVKKAGKAE